MKRSILLFSLLVTIFVAAAAVPAQADPGPGWVRLGDPLTFSGYIQSLAGPRSDPDVLYMLLEVGGPVIQAWRTTDGGNAWVALASLPSGTPCQLAVDPVDPNALAVSTNSAVFTSQDGGQTWKKSLDTRPATNRCGAVLAAPASGRLFAADDQTLYRSLDFGQGWEVLSIPPGPGYERDRLYPSPHDPDRVTVLYTGRFPTSWRTTDGGKTWVSVPPAADMAFDPLDAQRVYMVDWSAPTAQTLKVSADGGATWRECGLNAYASRVVTAGSRVYAAASPHTNLADRIYTSDDGCLSWVGAQESLSGLDFLLAYPGEPGRLNAAADAGPLASWNAGAAWTRLAGNLITPARPLRLVVDPANPDHLYAITGWPMLWNNALVESGDGGQTWSSPLVLRGTQDIALSAHRPGEVWISTGSSVLRRGDGGVFTTVLESDRFPTVAGVAVTAGGEPVASAGDDFSFGIAHWESSYRSPPGPYAIPYPAGIPAWDAHLVPDPLEANTYLLGASVYDNPASTAAVYRSEDGGKSWQAVVSPGRPWVVLDLVYSTARRGVVYTLGYDFEADRTVFLRSSDGGLTWVDWSEGLETYHFGDTHLAEDPLGRVCLAYNVGLICRGSGEAQWNLVDFQNDPVYAVAYQAGTHPGWVASTYSGVWKLPQAPVQTVWLPLVGK